MNNLVIYEELREIQKKLYVYRGTENMTDQKYNAIDGLIAVLYMVEHFFATDEELTDGE